MLLRGNGQLLVRVAQSNRGIIDAQAQGYSTEVLWSGVDAPSLDRSATTIYDWLLVSPTANRVPSYGASWVEPHLGQPSVLNPWENAHELAQANNYKLYAEPNLVQERPMPPRELRTEGDGGFQKEYPPFTSDSPSPGWHLDAQHAGFKVVRGTAQGRGVRIAHLDTGYTKWHASKPRHLLESLGKDFFDPLKNDATEPSFIPPIWGLNPGHGTATLALLAGNSVNLTFQGVTYEGDVGGAPEAEVLPVRIGPSVIHFLSHALGRAFQYAFRDLASCDGNAARWLHVCWIEGRNRSKSMRDSPTKHQ